VFYYTEDREMAFFPAGWTDVVEADPFVVLSEGQATARIEDLLRLAGLLGDLKARDVKEIRPNV
jgi:Family of unknown function (DUF5372)